MSMDQETLAVSRKLFRIDKPFAITMWDFSWIERRWPGAGYEDWDEALAQLCQRGYDAVRIDASPHLMAVDPNREWLLKPVWSTHAWGSPSMNRIILHDDFREFLAACRRHGVRVGLSTWFREDEDNLRMNISTPEQHAAIWVKTLDYIQEWGELDNVLFVDMGNEFPQKIWAPFFAALHENATKEQKVSQDWMERAVKTLKQSYPDIPVTFSFVGPYDSLEDMAYLDFFEPHIWMADSSGFYKSIGYNYDLFNDESYVRLQLDGERLYRENKQHYDECLVKAIRSAADWSRRTGKPLITTECWSVVDYKDWPLLNWDWILELNELGVRTAGDTGRWAGIATSNFCGPQFSGMWREVAWHCRMTELIHTQK